MTNNEKRAAALAAELKKHALTADEKCHINSHGLVSITEALNAAQAQGYKQGAEKMREALTPSGSTKAAYIGEFKFDTEQYDDSDDGYHMREVTVPWTTVKEIMAAILKRAESITPPQPATQAEDDVIAERDQCDSRNEDDEREMREAFEAAMQSLDNIAKNLAIGCQQSVSNDIWNAMEQAKAAWKEKSK